MFFSQIEYSATNPWISASVNICMFATSVAVSKVILRKCDDLYAKLSKKITPPSSNVRLFAILLASGVTAFASSRITLYHSSGLINHPLIKKTALVSFASLLAIKLLKLKSHVQSLSPIENRIVIGAGWTICCALITRALVTIASALNKKVSTNIDTTVCKALFCFMSVMTAETELKAAP